MSQEAVIGQQGSPLLFYSLSERVVRETAIPGPDDQVYKQAPCNGLYFRHSGRLLTSEADGDYAQRAISGYNKDKTLFEIQRTGSIARQRPRIERTKRTNPVFCLDNPTNADYEFIRWIDEEGLHQATPHNKDGTPVLMVVISWLGDTLLGSSFARDPASVEVRKARSDELGDPALPLFEQAQNAYELISSAK